MIGFIGVVARRGQCGRRLRGDRAHAEDVRDRRQEKGTRQKEGRCLPSVSTETLTQLSYFVTAALFILGLKRMSSPVTAVRGVRWAGAGMLLATLATLAFTRASPFTSPDDRRDRRRRHRCLGRAASASPMTDMPQMIALYNGMGGGAAAAIAAVELYKRRRAANLGRIDDRRRRRPHRLGLVQRQPDRVRQAAGTDHQVGALCAARRPSTWPARCLARGRARRDVVTATHYGTAPRVAVLRRRPGPRRRS